MSHFQWNGYINSGGPDAQELQYNALAPASIPMEEAAQSTDRVNQLTVVADSRAQQRSKSTFNWHDIEPILKWAAVAYGLGFVTVMWHTYRLGVPVLQLAEPANVWIGAPLAIVVFFLDKLVKAANGVRKDFVAGLTEARQMRSTLTESVGDLQNLADRAADVMTISLTLTVPFVVALRPVQRWIKIGCLRYIRPSAGFSRDRGISDEHRKRTFRLIGRILRWSKFVSVTTLLINSVAMFCLVPLCCFVYVAAIYPVIPQTLGGGRPVSVKLILSEDSIPQGEGFDSWLPPRGTSHTADSSSGSRRNSSIVVPVTLYFRTERDLYVRRKPTDPVVSLSEHAVEGIIFD